MSTKGADGFPHTSIMHCAADGLAMYFSTQRQRRKIQDIERDNRVSYAVAYMPPDGFYGRENTYSVQVRGRATMVESQEEIDLAVQRSYEQFEWLKDTTMYDIFKNPPPQMRSCFFRVDPVFALWQDNGVHMGWTQYLTFNAEGTAIDEMVPVDSPNGVALWEKYLESVDDTPVGAAG